MRKPDFCICETKTQISCAVTAQLISAFVFATRIVQFLYFLNLKFQVSHLLWLYSRICVGPGRKSRRLVFSQRGLYVGEIKGLVNKTWQRTLETHFFYQDWKDDADYLPKLNLLTCNVYSYISHKNVIQFCCLCVKRSLKIVGYALSLISNPFIPSSPT